MNYLLLASLISIDFESCLLEFMLCRWAHDAWNTMSTTDGWWPLRNGLLSGYIL